MARKHFNRNLSKTQLDQLSMYYAGLHGTAAILPRRTNVNAGVYPFVVMFSCDDGEGTHSCQSLDEAREVASTICGSGSVYAQSVSFRFRQNATVAS